MATTADEARHPSLHDDSRTDSTAETVVFRSRGDAPALLTLLDDEYTREIIAALSGGPRRGRDLIASSSASRPTVYRRLDDLEAAGLVTTEMTLDPDGHHCKTFQLVRDTLTVAVEDGAITVTARPAESTAETA